MIEKLQLIIIYALQSVDVASLVSAMGIQVRRLALKGPFSLYDKDGMSWPAVSKKCMRLPHFNIAADGMEASFVSGGTSKSGYSQFDIEATPFLLTPLGEWVEGLSTCGEFVMAWLVNSEYDMWQNAESLAMYVSARRDHSKLPKKSNGLPYPLTEEIVDISGNPGRYAHRHGYREAVAAEMWLGEPFWKLTGASREAVSSASWLRPVQSERYLHIKAYDQPFDSDQGEQRDLQIRLRELLYSSPNPQE